MQGATWEGRRLALVPEAWRGRVQRGYQKRLDKAAAVRAGQGKRTKAEQAANAWLADVSGIFERVRFPVGVTEGDIRDKAAECAAAAWSLAEIVPGVFVPDAAALRARLAGFVATFGVVPPGEKIKDGPAIARMTAPLWWRRALRVAQARQLERGAITLGYVHKAAEIYASDATVQRRTEQRRRNAAMMEATEAENLETGDVYTLAQLAAVSVANPAIRRGELMTRISGFEAVAKGLGHVAEFITLTCPSRFHRMRKADGGRIVPNSKHDGSSPRDAQKYLGRVWARIRAKLARVGLRVYGFRIAEPHHDACPHWHILLFMAAELRAGARSVPRFRAIFRRYALADSADEAGAKKYRVKFEAIDWRKGSAAGYVAKYISKNIDAGGYQVQGDIETGKDAIYPGQRVEAWASTWGIRQFQQVGGPPVGVWRELRRMQADDANPAFLNSAIAAADCGKNGKDENGTAGNWRRFVELMGGPVVARASLPLRVAYRDKPGRVDPVSGEISKARTVYGDEAAPVPCGVRYWGQVQRVEGIAVYLAAVQIVAESRRFSWAIKRGAGDGKERSAGQAGRVRLVSGYAAPATRGAGDGGGMGAQDGNAERADCDSGLVGGGFLGLSGGAAGAPRSPVNNCTAWQPAGAFCLVDFGWLIEKMRGEDGRKGEKNGGLDGESGEKPVFASGRKGGIGRPGENAGIYGA